MAARCAPAAHRAEAIQLLWLPLTTWLTLGCWRFALPISMHNLANLDFSSQFEALAACRRRGMYGAAAPPNTWVNSNT